MRCSLLLLFCIIKIRKLIEIYTFYWLYYIMFNYC